MGLSQYIGKIPIVSDILLSLCFNILKLLNGKNKSLISYSRPIKMKRYSYSAFNTEVINLIHLRNYHAIKDLQ